MLLVNRRSTDRVLLMKDRGRETVVNTTALNRAYVFRMRYKDSESGRWVNKLVTGKQFAEIIGKRSIHTLYKRVWNFTTDKLVIALRRGIRIEVIHRP